MSHYDDPLWTIITLAVIILAAIWANTNRQPGSTKTNKDSRPDKNDDRDSISVLAAARDGNFDILEQVILRENSSDRGADSIERNPHWASARWTEILAKWTALLAIAGILAAIFAWWTLNAIRGQLDVMEVDKRPWLRAQLSLDKVRLVDWDGVKGINVSLNIEIKNYGESPAVNMLVVPMIEEHPLYTDKKGMEHLDIDQAESCARTAVRAAENPIGGVPVFPGDTYSGKSNPGISGRQLYDSQRPPPWFLIYGCVNYTYSKDRHGETGFRMLLGKPTNGLVLGIPFQEGEPDPDYHPSAELLAHGYPAIAPRYAYVKIDDLIFRPDEPGNYAK
jgi:hypothetical protein